MRIINKYVCIICGKTFESFKKKAFACCERRARELKNKDFRQHKRNMEVRNESN